MKVRVPVDVGEALWAICEAKGYVARRANAPAGAESFEQARHFRSVFSTAGDCQILRTGLLAKLAEPTLAAAPAVQRSGERSHEVKSE